MQEFTLTLRDLIDGLSGMTQLSEECGNKLPDSASFRMGRILGRFKDEQRVFVAERQRIHDEIFADEDESDGEVVKNQRSREFRQRVESLLDEEVVVSFSPLSQKDLLDSKKVKISPLTWELLVRGKVIELPKKEQELEDEE